jgi:hypothetical protein
MHRDGEHQGEEHWADSSGAGAQSGDHQDPGREGDQDDGDAGHRRAIETFGHVKRSPLWVALGLTRAG